MCEITLQKFILRLEQLYNWIKVLESSQEKKTGMSKFWFNLILFLAYFIEKFLIPSQLQAIRFNELYPSQRSTLTTLGVVSLRTTP